jgi:hypothetical protein
MAAFSTDYGPVNTGNIKRAQVFEQRLDRKELNGCRSGTEVLHPRQAVALVLNAYAPPDMLLTRGETQLG